MQIFGFLVVFTPQCSRPGQAERSDPSSAHPRSPRPLSHPSESGSSTKDVSRSVRNRGGEAAGGGGEKSRTAAPRRARRKERCLANAISRGKKKKKKIKQANSSGALAPVPQEHVRSARAYLRSLIFCTGPEMRSARQHAKPRSVPQSGQGPPPPRSI